MVAQAFNRRGLYDWLVQRFTAAVLGAYSLTLFVYFLMVGESLTYGQWFSFMMATPMKVFNLVTFVALAGHAWVGLWTITTDYIKPWCLRILVQASLLIANLALVLWAFVIFFG